MVTLCKLGIIALATLLIVLPLLTACSSHDEETPTLTPAITTIITPTTSPISPVPLWINSPVVRTMYGDVKGFEDEADTWVWKAIPYAKPPIDELRWKAPQNPEPWDGIRVETDFCDLCPQYDPLMQETVIGNEDCLYLNIWRPQTEETGLPVYVWIHGGQSINSAAQSPTYYGSHLAHKSNMVFVSVDFRIGPLGWFTHHALRTGKPGDESDDSGNYGTLDLIQALKWIKDNIEAFGGDPDNVLITGESGGAENVLSLMLSPLAEGLFHKALARSGMEVSFPMEYGDDTANDVLLQLLVNDGTATDKASAQAHLNDMSSVEIATYLRLKTPAELLACYEKLYFGFISFPFIYEDGTVVVAEGFDAFRTGNYPNKVPIIMGTTKEEYKIFMFQNASLEDQDELYQAAASYGSQIWKAEVEEIARNLSSHENQPDVYIYQFNWGSGGDIGKSPIPEPYGFKIGAAHSLDDAFFLGTHVFFGPLSPQIMTEENRPGREALANAIMAYVAHFARTGNPNNAEDGLPDWTPWTNEPDEPKCILFNADLITADIEMSAQEYKKTEVLQSMQSELSAPLYSKVLKYMLSEAITSHLLKDVDLELFMPSFTDEPIPSPIVTYEPSQTPSPSQTLAGSDIWVYNVSYGDEETVWTVRIIGGETVDGVDCYVTETSYDTYPKRIMYAEREGFPVPLTLKAESTWSGKSTLQPSKAETNTTFDMLNLEINTTTTFTYDGLYGAPFSVGQTWSFSQLDSPDVADPLASMWIAEVVGIEEVFVPAGIFNCFKVVFTSGSKTRTIWYSANPDEIVAVKIMDEGTWVEIETRELAAYTQ